MTKVRSDTGPGKMRTIRITEKKSFGVTYYVIEESVGMGYFFEWVGHYSSKEQAQKEIDLELKKK